MNKTLPCLKLASFLATLTFAMLQSDAQVVILGNYPYSNDTGGTLIGPNTWKAVEFQMPAQSYDVGTVTLRLSSFDSTVDTPIVGIYNADGAGGFPGTQVGLDLTNPTGNTSPGDYNFLPSGTLTLSANQQYWLVVKGDASSSFVWTAASPTSDTPGAPAYSGQVATFDGYAIFNNPPGSWGASGTKNTFEIATPVPEPMLSTVAAAGALLSFVAYRTYKTTMRSGHAAN